MAVENVAAVVHGAPGIGVDTVERLPASASGEESDMRGPVIRADATASVPDGRACGAALFFMSKVIG